MYQSGRVGDEVKKRKSPAKSWRVGLTAADFTTVAGKKRWLPVTNDNPDHWDWLKEVHSIESQIESHFR